MKSSRYIDARTNTPVGCLPPQRKPIRFVLNGHVASAMSVDALRQAVTDHRRWLAFRDEGLAGHEVRHLD